METETTVEMGEAGSAGWISDGLVRGVKEELLEHLEGWTCHFCTIWHIDLFSPVPLPLP